MTAHSEFIVLSPHLDDAVLDCCDHIMMWKRTGSHVRVLTVFTAFSDRTLSQWTKHNIEESGCESLSEFERTRTREDIKAMSILGVLWEHLGLVDAGFRCSEEGPLYPNAQKLFSGVISSGDSHVLSELKQSLTSIKNDANFLLPLGVGNHVDHILVRKVAEEVFKPRNLFYYVDFPYALSIRNWDISHALKVITTKKSIKWMTKEKRRVLGTYTSQTPVLFSHIYSYPEIILHPTLRTYHVKEAYAKRRSDMDSQFAHARRIARKAG